MLGYREITLKSDTELAIIAFSDRVAAMCKAEVTTEDAVTGHKESNGLIENAVMLLRGIIRTIKCLIESRTQEPLGDDSPVILWLWSRMHPIHVPKGRDGRTPLERLHGKKPTQEFVPFGEKVLVRQITTDPRNRMNPRYQYGVWFGMRNNSADCFIGNSDGVLRAREIRRLEPQDRRDREAINSVIGVPWRMTDGQWTDQKFESTPFQALRCRLMEHESRGRESPSETLMSSEPRSDAQVAMKDNKRAQAHSDRCRTRIEECLRTTPHGAERLDRRNEVINEALAEEVRRGEQRKKRSDWATPETESAAPEPRENPIEPRGGELL